MSASLLTAEIECPWGAEITPSLRWLSRLGPAYQISSKAGATFSLPTPLRAIRFEGVIPLQSWLLVEGWWEGTLDSDRVVDLLGEEPDTTLDQALTDPELVERAWVQLRPSEMDAILRWGGEVLRGYDADAVVCEDALAILGSTAEVSRLIPQAPAIVGRGLMLSEVTPPRKEVPPAPVKPRRRGPPKVPKLIRSPQGSQGPLLDCVGVAVGFCGLSHPWVVDSPLELCRQLLLDGLDAEILRYANLVLPFRALGQELEPDELREMLVDHAQDLVIHPELAIQITGPLRARLRKQGHDGVCFRRGAAWKIVLPHYYLRSLSPHPLWQRICRGECLDA